jgi:putative ABC transport system permease protein
MTTRLALAFKNLGRNRRRNLATASAIILGYAGLILLSGFVTRIEKFFRATSVYLNHIGSISIHKPEGVEKHLLKPAKYSLSAEEQQKARQILERLFPQNEGIAASLHGFTLVGNGCKTWPVRVSGIETALEEKLVKHWAVKKFAPELLNSRRGKGLWEFKNFIPILMTEKVARNLGKDNLNLNSLQPVSSAALSSLPDCSAADFRASVSNDPNVQLAGRTFQNNFSAIDAEIVGFYSSGLELLEESAALLPLDALQKLYETEAVTKMAVYLPWDTPVEENAQRLAAELKKEGLELEVHHFKEFSVNPFYAGFMNLIYVMSGFFLTLAVCVVTLTVSDTMTMSVLERSKEIGTLRAVGFKRQQISRMFSEEGTLLGLLSLPAGLLVAWLVTLVVNSAKILFEVPGISTRLEVVLEIDPLHCAIVGLVLVGVTTISGWITSVRTSKRQIVKLLQSHVS